jgi:hypothetical protein
LTPVRTLEFTVSSGAITAKTPGANTPKGDTWSAISVLSPAICTGSLGALQNFGGYVGGALAPIVTGLIVQQTGSFVPALFVGAGLCLLAACSYLFLVRGPITVVENDGIATLQTT